MGQTSKLTHLLAGQVLNTVAPRIALPMNIMDPAGVIIASTDARRVGTVHRDALAAAKENRTVATYETDASGRRPGVNVPLNFAGQCQGVVGLTGDPTVVAPLAQLICLTIELLINQYEELSSFSELHAQRTELLAALASGSVDPLRLDGWLEAVGMHAPYMLSLYAQDADFADATTLRSGELHWVLSVEKANLPQGRAVIGAARTTASELLIDAQNLRELSRHPLLLPQESDWWDLDLAIQAAKLSAEACALAAASVERLTVEHARTLMVLAGCSSTAEASEHLKVHRNTLMQRMERIKGLTGRDPKVPVDLMALLRACYAAARTGDLHIF